jgi:hypothetical protein
MYVYGIWYIIGNSLSFALLSFINLITCTVHLVEVLFGGHNRFCRSLRALFVVCLAASDCTAGS